MVHVDKQLLLQRLSAGTGPKALLWEWALAAGFLMLLGAGFALVVISLFIPVTSAEESIHQREQLEAEAQKHFDSAGVTFDVRDPFPGDPEFQAAAAEYWEKRRYESRHLVRNVGLALLGAASVSLFAALFLRARRTRTAGHLRLIRRIMEMGGNSNGR